MGTLARVLFIPVICAVMGYYLYTPLPDGLRQKSRIQLFYAKHKISSLLISMGVKLGFGSGIELARRYQHYTMVSPLNDENITVTNTTFSGIPVMIFTPNTVSSKSPAIVYFHGGGWMFLSSGTKSHFTNNLYRKSQINVLNTYSPYIITSFSYRLSPEHPFPAAFDDCVTATVHVLQNGHKFGVDSDNVGVAGDSAGGNLAAAVALRLSDEKESRLPKLRFQIIIYSVLQAWDFKLPSYTHNEITLFPSSVMIKFILPYLGEVATDENIAVCLSNNHLTPALKKSKFTKFVDQSLLPPQFRRTPPKIDDVLNTTLAKRLETLIINPYAFPLMAKDLSRLPPAFVLTCQHDLTRDDALMYVERLRKAGIDVQHKHVTDAVHDFFLRAPNNDFTYDVHLETLSDLKVYANKYYK
ncbi:hypothetical protein LOTGIDRAFT_139240 [Lottia gigantea]|uniref:Alpha/beta hydrolase fold-3 domain-containing protein n=1 Tax=Lottia gigantea TaxID=225164 RepID=V4AW76_LOTGI|nr:hypothetical protein LOTGIDRAFT_139240 [Lottia gigantea]ESP01718.1 hypothetical protein LOTGIDRAFT_139240 [Lottia gigantea]